MWRLPRLEWRESIWRLPLRPDVASDLTMALLEEPAECQHLLANLLQADSALLLWVMCQAPTWRTSSPANPAAPAEWLLQTAIPGGLLEVESDGALAKEHDAPNAEFDAPQKLASDNYERESANWPRDMLQDALELLSQNGPIANRESMQGCPWFPVWLLSEKTISPESRPGSLTQPLTLANRARAPMSPLLPRVIQLIRRVNKLESQFAAELEREKLAALRELAYGASHEINNPLANIATRAQALLREESNPDRKRKLSTIAAQAFRAHEMISDMMLFAKPPAPEFQPTDIAGVVREVVREMFPEATSQETQLQADELPDSFVVPADPTQLGVAVKALVRNALEALATGGSIEVTAKKLANDAEGTSWIEIAVTDSGPGISPEVRRHLFDPFYSGREAGRGLGFGLAKCWRIAELHRGQILVDSEPGKGATFKLRLPST